MIRNSELELKMASYSASSAEPFVQWQLLTCKGYMKQTVQLFYTSYKLFQH